MGRSTEVADLFASIVIVESDDDLAVLLNVLVVLDFKGFLSSKVGKHGVARQNGLFGRDIIADVIGFRKVNALQVYNDVAILLGVI